MPPGNTDGSTGSRGKRSKIRSNVGKYGLEGIEAEILARRRGEKGEEESLRDLADFFNVRILEAALEETGTRPLQGEIENLYRLLTGEDVSKGMGIEARDRLARQGIDFEEIESDFISYQSINRYLKNNEEYDPSDHSSQKRDEGTLRDRLFKLQSRMLTVTQSTLGQFTKRDGFSLGEFDVYVTVSVSCRDCGTTKSLTELLDDSGCECGD